jgi:hypothetical protein
MNVFDGKSLFSEISKSWRKWSPWEKGFINDIGKQLDRGFKLSDRQGVCLEKIYRKSQGG